MGYTHYWKMKKAPKDIQDGAELFKMASEAARECISRLPKRVPDVISEYNNETGEYEVKRVGFLPFKICGGTGEGEPTFTDTLVSFNGDAADGYDHETCYIDINDSGFQFCKTARKPYDVAVCVALLCFAHYFGDNFEYSSDGDIEAGEEGWAKAKEITSKYFEK